MLLAAFAYETVDERHPLARRRGIGSRPAPTFAEGFARRLAEWAAPHAEAIETRTPYGRELAALGATRWSAGACLIMLDDERVLQRSDDGELVELSISTNVYAVETSGGWMLAGIVTEIPLQDGCYGPTIASVVLADEPWELVLAAIALRDASLARHGIPIPSQDAAAITDELLAEVGGA